MVGAEPASGGNYRVTREVAIDGLVLFRRGETVTVESIDPDPHTPEHKFVVSCAATGTLVRLAAEDLDCAHDFSFLPDETRFCRNCGLNVTPLGTPLPRIARNCSVCGSILPDEVLACPICGTGTPWAMRKKMIIDEQRSSKNRVHGGSLTPADGADALEMGIEIIFDILSGRS